MRQLAPVAYCLALGFAVWALVDSGQALRWDNLVHNFPLTLEVFRQWGQGRLPAWNPYIWSGSPLLADPQAQVAYPLTWLAYALAGDPAISAMRILFALHVVVAAAGAYVLGRALGFTVAGGLLAATVYALNPYFAYLATGFANELATLAWLPWIAFAVARAAVAERPWRWIALGGVLAALAWSAGYPQLWLYDALVVVALGWSVARGRVVALWRVVTPLAVGLALSLYQIVPFLPLWLSSQRADARSLKEFLRQDVPFDNWPAILVPGLVGSIRNGFSFSGNNLPYLGLIAVTFALIALRRPSPVRVCLAATVGLGLWLASGAGGGLLPLLHELPFLSLLRGPHKFFSWVVLGVALLAGAGAGDVQRGPRRWHAAALGAAVACALAVFLARPALVAWVAASAGRLPEVAFVVGVGGALAVVALLLAGRPRTAVRLAVGATLASFVVELAIYAPPHPVAVAALAPSPALEALASAKGDWRHHWSINLLAPIRKGDVRRALGVYRELEMTNGYSAFLDPGYAQAVGIDAGVEPIATRGVRGVLESQNRVLDVLAGRYVLVAPQDELARLLAAQRTPLGLPLYTGATMVGENVMLERRAALPRVREVLRVETVPDRAAAVAAVQKGSINPAVVALVEEPIGPLRAATRRTCRIVPERRAAGVVVVEVVCRRPSFLVFAERFDPGWTASVDGAPVPLHRAYGLVLGVRVDAGRHRVVLRYVPPRLAAGAAASALVALALLAVVGLELRAQRRATAAPAG